VLVENFFSRFEALERTVAEQSQTIVDQRSMIDSVVRMHEGLRRQVVQAHPSFPLPDITLPDTTSPQPASTTPDVIYARSWEFTDVDVTPAVVASADRVTPIAGSVTPQSNHQSPWVEVGSAILARADRPAVPSDPFPGSTLIASADRVAPIAGSSRPSPGNIPSLPGRSSSDVTMKAVSVTATSPQRSPAAIVTRADRPAVLPDELPGHRLTISNLSGPRSTDAIIKASSLTPRSLHLSPSVEVGSTILARADRAAMPSDAFLGSSFNITSFSGPPATDGIRKASPATPKSTHPIPSVDIRSVPISASPSDTNLLATEKLVIQDLNPVIVGPFGMTRVPPVSSSCPLPSIDLNLTSLQDAPPPNLIPAAFSVTPKGGVVTSPMPLALSMPKPAAVVGSSATPTSGGMIAPAAVVVNPVGMNEDSGVPEIAGLLRQPNDTITNSNDSTPSYTPHSTPPALPLTNPFPSTPSLRISTASPTLPWHTWPISPVPDISRLHVDAPVTPSTAFQHAAVPYDSPRPLGRAVLMIPTGNAGMNTPGTPSSTSDVSMDISSDGKQVNEV
jgi:hypothetical protein